MPHSELNLQYRQEFLRTLPERLDKLEHKVQALPHAPNINDAFAELFRLVHGLRGSSATFELECVAAVCQPLEEEIQRAAQTDDTSTETLALLQDYLALIRENTLAALSGITNFDATEKSLLRLQRLPRSSALVVGIAVHSRTLQQICTQVAYSQHARVVRFDNSLHALQRLLIEPFDAVIVASELYPLRGEALLSALAISRRHQFRTILITANKRLSTQRNRVHDPDHVLEHDANLLPELWRILGDIGQDRRQGVKP